mgnify:FL=1
MARLKEENALSLALYIAYCVQYSANGEFNSDTIRSLEGVELRGKKNKTNKQNHKI